MKEVQRIAIVYEAYIIALLKVVVELIGWQQRVSPETEAKMKALNRKRVRIQRRYLK